MTMTWEATQAPTEDTHPTDAEVAARVRDLFYRAREHKRPRVEQWRRNYRVVMNRTWSPSRASWLPHPQVPEIQPILSAIVAWQTDTAPTFDVTPQADPNSPFHAYYSQLAADLKLTLRSAQTAGDYETQLQLALWDTQVYGTGILKATWDKRASAGLGNAVMLRVDPFAFYPDPDANGMDDAAYFIEYHEMSRDQLLAQFGEEAVKKVGARGGDIGDVAPNLLDLEGDGRANRENLGAIPPATVAQWSRSNPYASRPVDLESERFHVLEAWLRVPDPDKAYDCWRCVFVCENVVLFDALAHDMWEHGQHPYDRLVPLETGEFWPMSMAEALTPLQLSVNRNLAAIEHNLWLMGNPVMVEDQRALTQRTKVTNRPGQRITKTAGSDVSWLDPPQIHPQLGMQLIDFYIGEMERISGLSAVVRGATPTGRNAQGVMDSVQEAAFVRIRMALRNLEVVLRNQGEKLASLIAEFYDAPRVVAIVGPSGEQTATQLRAQHFYTPTPDGPAPMRFQLLVQAGSATPTSRGARSAEARELYALGVVDEEAVLSVSEFPNWQAVVARVREAQAAAGTMGLPPTQRAAARR